MTTGIELWRGPSLLDGSPIVVLVTGLDGRSRNPKTGPMAQAWILAQDKGPTAALRDGTDKAICGECPLRPSAQGRRCYVQVQQAPLAVWRAWKRGVYPQVEFPTLRGRSVRLGAYGDPAAVPVRIWVRLTETAAGHTGYTHQWRRPDFDARLLDLCMASVEGAADVAELRVLHGPARYFRVRPPGEERWLGEMQCPASAEAGKRLDCATCGACDGGSEGRSVSIAAHGGSALAHW